MTTPLILRTIEELKEFRKSLKDKKIGFVPTMGYLHEGHLSLVKKSNEICDFTIVSIYVNPSQFGKNEDLDKYPQDLQRDLDLLSRYKTDAVFTPMNSEMYPEGYKTWVEVDNLSSLYCGASRPGHFRGVTTIVLKLINLVKPDLMFMGEKDFQQIAVLNKMIADLNIDTKIVPCPIIRENDGLAMSSRNAYLNEIERLQARCLNQALIEAGELYKKGIHDLAVIRTSMQDIIESQNGKIDYIEFINPVTLDRADSPVQNTHILLAVYIGSTRLIDNRSLEQ